MGRGDKHYALLLCTGILLHVAAIASGYTLSGRVIDSMPLGARVANATVSLRVQGRMATTDTQGRFSLDLSAGVIANRASRNPAIKLVGTRLTFFSNSNELVTVSLFDLRGRKWWDLQKTIVEAGEFSCQLPGGGLSVLSVHKGHEQVVRLMVQPGRSPVSSKNGEFPVPGFDGATLMAAAPTNDTLSIVKNGFIPYTAVVATNASKDLGDIVLSYFVQQWPLWPMPDPPAGGGCNAARYTAQADSTVLDNVTGLTWQKNVPSTKYTWMNARRYCVNLSLAGGGWRLPSRIEMMSLVDYTKTSPAIDKAVLPTPAAFFHTASPWTLSVTDTGRPNYAWIFNFYEGLTSNAGDQFGEYCVRCVRGHDNASPGVPANQYTLVATNEALDNYTGLVWQRDDSPSKLTRAEATDYCSSLALNGHAWRLPSIKELATLVDETRVAPAINVTVFPGTSTGEHYWSSSSWAGDSTKSSSGAWGINYADGFTGYNWGATAWVRCVRCGE